MRRLWLGLCALLLLGSGGTAHAHHVSGHGGGGSNYFNPFSTQSRPPRSFLSFTFNLDSLDDDLGVVLRYQLSGEYAVHRRFSVGATVPFLTTREKFLPETTGIGDVVLNLKGLLWRPQGRRMALTIGTGVSFPTGNEADGLGAGEFLFSPYLNYTAGVGRVEFYSTLGTTLAAADSVSPTFDYNTGVNVRLFGGEVPIHGFLAFQGSTTFVSDVLENGSTKAYLTPGVIFYLSNSLITTLGARVSILDTLEIKPGVALAKTSPILLSDVRVGFNFNIDYFF